MKDGAELGWVQNILENALTDADLYRKVRNSSAQEAERAIGMFSELKDRAALGEKQARDTIVEYFADVIRDRAGKNTGRIISGLVDFDDVCNNGDDVIFEMLTDGRSFGGILEKYAAEDVFDGEMLRKAAEKENENGEIKEFYSDQEKRLMFVAERMGLPQNAKDYTMSQNESYINPVYNKNGKPTRPSNYMPNSYWDFSKTGKENAEIYLKMCAANNRKPKFSQFLVDNKDGSYSLQPDGSTDGYWKLLIDFKMYNNDGKGVPQAPVKPNFTMNEATRMLNEYKGGHHSL